MKLRHLFVAATLAFSFISASAIDNPGIVNPDISSGLVILHNGEPIPIYVANDENIGVKIAADNLSKDFGRVCGKDAMILSSIAGSSSSPVIIATTFGTLTADALVKKGILNPSDLKGKREKYIMTTVKDPLPGIGEALVIAGSDRRGTIYGIYELSEQIGVSPWYDWADVPVARQTDLSLKPGSYTAGEPAVKYRGIFLNDEAPCLTSWVKNTYGTNYGDHNFYARVNELILRLRGNFLWPAMWVWAFYGDDPLNSKTADDMGIIMGTSHHEPMARNHQEWARNRNTYGKWDYKTNRETIDRFFLEGIERMKGTEDIVTIGMRGDGDEAMSEDADIALLDRIIKNQRKMIKDVTRKNPKETPQVWALYKEVQDYYDKGLRAPDDVIYLLCDDNWGNIRRLPDDKERKHPGGWGMYYHVDYVGAPRNSKLINVSPVQNMWEQMNLTYDYGVDKLWVLNVGDLKPMEYPITQFLSLAWNPKKYGADNILGHLRDFCDQQFGKEQGKEAARIIDLYTKYNGRVTPEMLDRDTYNLATGEWKQVADDYARLEVEALRQFVSLRPEYRDAYRQLVLFPIQLMSALYEMYYSQAMNHKLYAENNPDANLWADRTEECFRRDQMLIDQYNNEMSGGKWKGMMTQKHIGYKIWNDDFKEDTCPEVFRISDTSLGGYTFLPENGAIVMEAEHFNQAETSEGREWTLLPGVGRTRSGIAVTPYTVSPEKSVITYRMKAAPECADSLPVHVILKSTLAFSNPDGHRFKVGFKGAPSVTVNYNSNLNEKPENIYDVFYPTVARRVIECVEKLPLPSSRGEYLELEIEPLDPGAVFEKIVVDLGGYRPSYLFGNESPSTRNK